MPTTPVKLNNATDTWVFQFTPTTAKGTTGTLLYVGAVSTKNMRSLLYYTLPFRKGVTIISAKLRFVQYGTTAGSHTISVRRAAAAWSATKATWNNQPAQTGTAVALTKVASPSGTNWEFDVTAHMQSISAGAAWYGFVVSSTATTQTRFHSPNSGTITARPVLEISWKDNPQKPTMLYPSNGRATSLSKPTLRTTFIDLSGDTTMQSIQVRIFDTEALALANTAPTWDSGTVASSAPELDLNTTAYPGAAAGSTKWWRVRVQDGSGLWSDWSEYTSFAVMTKGVLTMTNPSGATVSDSSPPVTWTFTGRTQKAYQLIVRHIYGSFRNVMYDSGKITSTDLNATPSPRAMRYDDQTYEIILRVWDTIDRESLPGDTAYAETTRTVTYLYSATVAPATSLVGTAGSDYPWMTLDWSRSVLPDRWTIYRDGKVIWSGEAADLLVSGTAHRYVDRLADPRTPHTWKVVAVVNGVGSASAPTVSATITPLTVTLARADGTEPVLIFDHKVSMGLTESSGIFQPAGDSPPVIITQSEHGYQGHVSGRLVDAPHLPGVTARQWRDRFNRLKKNNGTTLLLTVIDVSIECFIAKATIRPVMPGPGIVWYEVEFDFYQTDWEEVP